MMAFERIGQADDRLFLLLASVKLLPCPFCGSEDIKATIMLKGGVHPATYYHLYTLFCGGCGATNSMDDPEALIAWWNLRTSSIS